MAASIITPSTTLTSPAMQRDLHDIRAVEIDIGRVYGGDGVLIRASSWRWGSSSPLVVKLAGHDQTRFEGPTRQLREMLQPRERLGVAWFRDWRPPAYLVGAVVTIAGVGLALQGDKHMSNAGQGAASVGSGALVVGALKIVVSPVRVWVSPFLKIAASGPFLSQSRTPSEGPIAALSRARGPFQVLNLRAVEGWWSRRPVDGGGVSDLTGRTRRSCRPIASHRFGTAAPVPILRPACTPGWGPGGRRFKSCLPDQRNAC
jgi:hypothetical protein